MAETLLKPLKAGLIGAGIQASLTPAMHMKEGADQGFRYEYELIDLNLLGLTPSSLPDLLDDAEARGLIGLNITHPCKQVVIPYLDELSDEARALGAVNTVVLKDGKRFGHNTDWWGFAESFRRGLPGADLSAAVQIGAGGAGVATAYAILSLGLTALTVFDREPDRAEQLVQTMSVLFRGIHKGVTGYCFGDAGRLGHHPCDADWNGQISRCAAAAGASPAASLGRGDCLFPA